MSTAGKLQLAWSNDSPKPKRGGGGDGPDAPTGAFEQLLATLDARGLKHEANTAFFLWPSLQEAAVRICEHLGDRLKESNRLSIAHDVVCRAVLAFAERYQVDRDEEESALAFLKVVGDLAETLLQLKVSSWTGSPDNAVHWEIFRESYEAFVLRAARKFGSDAKVRISTSPTLYKDEIWAARRAWPVMVLTVRDQRLLARAEMPR